MIPDVVVQIFGLYTVAITILVRYFSRDPSVPVWKRFLFYVTAPLSLTMWTLVWLLKRYL